MVNMSNMTEEEYRDYVEQHRMDDIPDDPLYIECEQCGRWVREDRLKYNEKFDKDVCSRCDDAINAGDYDEEEEED